MQVEECVHAVHAWAYEEFSFLPQPTRPTPLPPPLRSASKRKLKRWILPAFVWKPFRELCFKPPTPSYRVRSIRKTVLRILINRPRDVESLGAIETNLYIAVKHRIKDPFKVCRPCRRKLRKAFGFYSFCSRPISPQQFTRLF